MEKIERKTGERIFSGEINGQKVAKRRIVAVLIANLVNVAFSLVTNFLLPKYL